MREFISVVTKTRSKLDSINGVGFSVDSFLGTHLGSKETWPMLAFSSAAESTLAQAEGAREDPPRVAPQN